MGLLGKIGTGFKNLPRRTVGTYGKEVRQADIRTKGRTEFLGELSKAKGPIYTPNANGTFDQIELDVAVGLPDEKIFFRKPGVGPQKPVALSATEKAEMAASFADEFDSVKQVTHSLLGLMNKHKFTTGVTLAAGGTVAALMGQEFPEPAPVHLDPTPPAAPQTGAQMDPGQMDAAQLQQLTTQVGGMDPAQLQALAAQLGPSQAQTGGTSLEQFAGQLDPRLAQGGGVSLEQLAGQLDPRLAQAGGPTVPGLMGAGSAGGQTQAIDLNALSAQLGELGQ